ncbi:hypothetical protein FRC17_009684 [Serendipita sp. 399]|nr:hypothetical protein FRC17_009684 [Serendipita sp. 399]
MTRLLAGKFASYSSIKEFAATRFRHTPGAIRSSIKSKPLRPAVTFCGGEYWDAVIKEGWTYDIATDGQIPDPPLKKEIDDWLKGKWSRRQEYTRYISDAKKQGVTFQSCSICRLAAPTIVTAHTLDGDSEEE